MRVQRGKNSGQATVLVLALVAVAVLIMVAMAGFGVRLVAIEHAQVAADAAALAGTLGGRDAAHRLAAANGGVLVSFELVGDIVRVVVVVGSEPATAEATRAP